MKTADISSFKIIRAIDSFKNLYFNKNIDSTISTSNATKKDKCDKGFYEISFSLIDSVDVPYFLDNDNYTEEVKEFFQKELDKEIRFLMVSWTYRGGTKKAFDMSIEIRF